MQTFLILAISILIPFIAGYALLSFLFWKERIETLFKIALAYGLGIGILSIWMMILAMVHMPMTKFSIGVPLILFSLSLISLIIKKHRKKKKPKYSFFQNQQSNIQCIPDNARRQWLFLKFILIVFIALNILYVSSRALKMPIRSWDAVATIAYKAKIIYFEKSLPHLNLLPHPTYPLLVPFNEAWIALNLGHWSETYIKIIFPLIFLSYIIIHYKFLHYLTNKTWALLGCVILLSSNLFVYHATISYRDFPLMYFNCTTIMLLILWKKYKVKPFLVIASLFAGFASFTKLEGSAFIFIYLLICLFINFTDKTCSTKKKVTNTIKFSIFPLITCFSFHIFKFLNHATAEKTKIDFTFLKLLTLPKILLSFAKNLFLSWNWGIVWFAVFISLFYLRRKKNLPEIRITLLCIILFFTLYASVSLFTDNYYWIAGEGSLHGISRLLLHFYPLAALLIILLNYPNTTTLNNNSFDKQI